MAKGLHAETPFELIKGRTPPAWPGTPGSQVQYLLHPRGTGYSLDQFEARSGTDGPRRVHR